MQALGTNIHWAGALCHQTRKPGIHWLKELSLVATCLKLKQALLFRWDCDILANGVSEDEV